MKLQKIILATSGVGATGSQEWAWRADYGGVEQIGVIDGGSLDEVVAWGRIEIDTCERCLGETGCGECLRERVDARQRWCHSVR